MATTASFVTAGGSATAAGFVCYPALAKPHEALEGIDRCGDCHGPGKRVNRGGCLRCHDDVGARLASGRGLHARRDYASTPCEACHTDHNGAKTIVVWPDGDAERFDHALSGWSLRGEHARVVCSECHGRLNARGHASYLTASPACGSCHFDAHLGRLGPACERCHSEVRWR